MNSRRPKLKGLLADRNSSVIVVEHRDRLSRFGFDYIEAALSASGRRVVVIEPGELQAHWAPADPTLSSEDCEVHLELERH